MTVRKVRHLYFIRDGFFLKKTNMPVVHMLTCQVNVGCGYFDVFCVHLAAQLAISCNLLGNVQGHGQSEKLFMLFLPFSGHRYIFTVIPRLN